MREVVRIECKANQTQVSRTVTNRSVKGFLLSSVVQGPRRSDFAVLVAVEMSSTVLLRQQESVENADPRCASA